MNNYAVLFSFTNKKNQKRRIFQAAAVFGAGLLVGLVNLLAAYFQAKVCANGIAAIGNGNDVMGKTLILAAFPELYAILGVAATFLISGAIAPVEVAVEEAPEAVVEVVEAPAAEAVEVVEVVNE